MVFFLNTWFRRTSEFWILEQVPKEICHKWCFHKVHRVRKFKFFACFFFVSCWCCRVGKGQNSKLNYNWNT